MDSRERSDLVAFLDQVEELMDWAVHKARGRLLAYLRPSLEKAWPTTAERFASVRTAILSGDLDDALREHGLSGEELVPKLSLFEARYAEWARLRAREQRRDG